MVGKIYATIGQLYVIHTLLSNIDIFINNKLFFQFDNQYHPPIWVYFGWWLASGKKHTNGRYDERNHLRCHCI